MIWQKKFKKHKKRFVTALAALVVFVTTYALIIPAITIDQERAEEEPGFVLEEDNSDFMSDEEFDDEEFSEFTDDEFIDEEESESMTQEEESEETWGEEETEVLMPEMTLKKKIGEVTITAEVSEDSLPEGTRLEVTEVEDTETLELIETAVDEDIKIDHVAAFDIRFLSPEGEEIEPEKPVKVSMVSQEVKEAEDTVVVHLDDDTQKSEVIEQVDEVTDEDEVAFESDSFSVYGFVFTQKLTKTVLTEEGDTYIVTVHLDENSGIPEDAELVVSELTEGSESYEEHLTQAREALNMDSKAPVRFARFFDIEIQKDGEKLEPATPAKVELTYVDPLNLEDEENLSVVHFADSGIEVIDDLKVSDDEKKITYEQESFSVIGTIIQGTLGHGQQGMLIVRDNGNEYVVLSDGTLEAVDSINWAENKFETSNPMVWKYTNDTYYHETRAYDFASNQTASDFYYSYINAKEADGIGDDNESNIRPEHPLNQPAPWGVDGRRIGDYSHRDMWSASATILENHHMKNRDPDNGQYYYIGVERGTDGKPVRITGRNSEADAAEIYLATTSVPSSDPGRNRVNHIDISIKGNVSITYPLTRGVTYYYEDGTTYTPTEKTNVTLSQEVGIKTDDMRKATITAFTKDSNGARHTYNEAFYITGYSANAQTQYSTDQVRIEGSFKVTTTDSTDWAERIKPENRIYYSVEASKPVTFNVTDSTGRQLYDENHKPITVTTNVSMSASFDYWDERNECPPVRWTLDSWRQGDIMSHGLSGMDFVMGGDTNLNTLEIIKMVEDEEGHLIKMPTGTSFDHDFDIYQRVNGQWHLIDTKTAEVSQHGIGFTSDYGIPDGSYVIREKTDTIQQEITDANGDTWVYAKTYFETEGSNRRDWPNDHDRWGADPNLYESEAGLVGASDRDLQFTCHNIYVKKTSVEVEKKWYQDGEEVTAPDGAEITVTLGRYVKNSSQPETGNPNPETESQETETDSPEPQRIPAKIDIYRSNWGRQSLYSNETNFYAGQTLHITLNKQKQATVSYTVNNGQKITLPVEQSNSAREDYTFDVVVPADGIVNIALDDAWSDVQNIRVVASDSANSVRRAPSAIRTENITVTTDGQPPEGYHVDTSFVQLVILSNAAGWSRSVPNLDSKDAKGNDYLYYIAKIEEKNVPKGTDPQVQAPLTTTGDEPLIVHNILPTPTVDISFGKAWYGADSQPVTEWPTDVDHISVTLRRYYLSNGQQVYDPEFKRDIEVNQNNGKGYSVEQKDTGEYWFTVKELDQYFIPSEGTKVNWIYTIAENELTNYHIKYRTSDGAEASGATYVTDGGTIENHLNVYSLPHTGGTGTLIYTLTGGILFILGLLVLLYRLFRERRLEC